MNEEKVIIDIINKHCKQCEYYNEAFRVCAGEMLPVEKAIARNFEGKGLCEKVKKCVEGTENV